jgi:hypothetical protein
MEPMRKLLLFEKQAQRSGEVSPRGLLGRENSYLSSAGSGIGVSGSRPGPSNAGPVNPGRNGQGGLPGVGRLGRPSALRNNTKDDPGAHSLLGNLEGGDGSGISTEFEVEVPLPGCQIVRTPIDTRNKHSPLIPIKFHHGTIWENIAVHHWIKIVLRISKTDDTEGSKSKRRHFEISIDSPIHLLSVLPTPLPPNLLNLSLL